LKEEYKLKQTKSSLTRSVLEIMKPYSPGKPIWEVQQELGIEEVVKLASNENPLGASKKAKEAIINYLSEIHRYPDANTTKLREAISHYYHVNEEQIIVGNGADELITLISETFLEEGDEIIVPSPSFSEYEFGANLMGAKVVTVPLTTKFEYDMSLILKSITDKTKIIYLCSPNNPTGTYIKKDVLDDFFKQLPKNLIVVFDGAYSHYANRDDYTNGIEYVKNGNSVIVIQTFSKIYGLAGIRVGYGISLPEIVNSIHKVREPFNVNALAQVAGEAALNDYEHVKNSQHVTEQGRNYLYDEFNNLGVSYIESMSNFILVEIGNDALSVYKQLLQKGIIVRYGNVWGLPNHLRITIGNDFENKKLIEVLKDLIA
jgi:histidinol-phosphate aminotransferase